MELKAQIIELEQLEKELQIVHLAVGQITTKLQGILISYSATEGAKEIFEQLLESFQKIDAIDTEIESASYIPFKQTVDNTKTDIFKLLS